VPDSVLCAFCMDPPCRVGFAALRTRAVAWLRRFH
jgi:hypothetical protein